MGGACALLVYFCLRMLPSKNPLYHLNTRIALIVTLPLGIITSLILRSVPEITNATSSTPATFILVQNPLPTSAETGTTADTAATLINWSDPHFWIGLVTLALLAVGFCRLLKLGETYRRIATFIKKLEKTPFSNISQDLDIDSSLQQQLVQHTALVFTAKTKIPYTFGWLRPTIVIPNALKDHPKKLRMAILHELMHIKRGDFLVNSIIKGIKSLFWFHPFIHLFDHELQEYRELSCDAEVLADQSISAKNYAQLLFELAQKKKISTPGIISMSVQQSNLQQRIKTMKTLNDHPRPQKSSVIVSTALLFILTGLIGCSQLKTANQPSLIQTPGISWNDSGTSAIADLPGGDLNISQQQQSQDEEHKPGNSNQTPASDLQRSQPESPEEEFSGSKTGPLPKLTKDFQRCVRYPEAARKEGIEGLIILEFAVNKNGWAENITVRRAGRILLTTRPSAAWNFLLLSRPPKMANPFAPRFPCPLSSDFRAAIKNNRSKPMWIHC
ncbi:MAG: M56 family metallopeptidase [Balneolaceae bacterium]|nr:M56 family metallopeptidase [Balneolaceae bacterium]